MRIRDVRLHDPGGARFRVPDSKTESGIRVVEMSPDLVEAFVDHLDRLRRAGQPTGPDDFVVQNTRHGRIGIGCVETAEHAAVASLAPEHVRGSAFGVLAGVQSLGNLVASAVAGVLYTAISPAAAFIYAALLMAGALLAFAVAGRR